MPPLTNSPAGTEAEEGEGEGADGKIVEVEASPAELRDAEGPPPVPENKGIMGKLIENGGL